MAGKVKGGLGKTARSSTVFNRKEGPSGHSCQKCSEGVKLKDLTVVLVYPGRKRLYFHTGCYSGLLEVSPGKGTSEHSEGGAVKKKQSAWTPNCFVGRKGWQDKAAGHRAGYDRAYGYGHLSA